MNLLVTQCPTMANSAALHTVPELRIALEQANSDLIDMALQLADANERAEARLKVIGHNVNVMVTILKAFKVGDRANLDKHLSVQLAEFERILATDDYRISGQEN
ncbi:MAG: hypothetical protein PHP85_14665 [Gallionella sp.]|nr:hypothetical protein [Gallionella sp.]